MKMSVYFQYLAYGNIYDIYITLWEFLFYDELMYTYVKGQGSIF